MMTMGNSTTKPKNRRPAYSSEDTEDVPIGTPHPLQKIKDAISKIDVNDSRKKVVLISTGSYCPVHRLETIYIYKENTPSLHLSNFIFFSFSQKNLECMWMFSKLQRNI